MVVDESVPSSISKLAATKRGEEGGGTGGEGTERKKKGGRKNKEPIEPLPKQQCPQNSPHHPLL